MKILILTATGLLLAACGGNDEERLDNRSRAATTQAAIEQAARDGRCAELQSDAMHECLRIAPYTRSDAKDAGADMQRQQAPAPPPPQSVPADDAAAPERRRDKQ